MAKRSHHALLIVDADSAERQDIGAFLNKAGFATHLCASPTEASEWLQGNSPVGVVADVSAFEEGSSTAFIEGVKSRLPEVPLILMGEGVTAEDVVQAHRDGASDFLLKPLNDYSDIIEAMHRAQGETEVMLQANVYRQELELANRELREYVRVLERDQKAGRRVQSKLLPEAPAEFKGYNINYRMVPSLYLSGDFIDFGLLNDRYLAFYLTDVSGHGAASAFVTVWLKQLVRRYFRENKIFHSSESFEGDAARLLALINREVIHSGVGCHMTCFVGVIDTHTRQMRYVFGGHLPFPILITDEGARYLSGKGKPVGIFPEASWDVHETVLPEKFSLLVFSDGILEVLPEQELIDKENSLLSIVRDAPKSVESLSSAFGIDEMENVPDDIAIMLIQSE